MGKSAITPKFQAEQAERPRLDNSSWTIVFAFSLRGYKETEKFEILVVCPLQILVKFGLPKL